MAILISSPEDPRQTRADKQLIELEGACGLSTWEEEFISDLLEERGRGHSLTDRQLAKLDQVHEARA